MIDLARCAGCHQEKAVPYMDKRYKHSICAECFSYRRWEARMAGDSEWFEANVPLEQMTEDEKLWTGLPRNEKESQAGFYGGD